MNFKQRLSLVGVLLSGSMFIATGLVKLEIIKNWPNPHWYYLILTLISVVIWLSLIKHYSQDNFLKIKRHNEQARDILAETNRQIEAQNLEEFGETYYDVNSDVESAYSHNSWEYYRIAGQKLAAMHPTGSRPCNLRVYNYSWFWPWLIVNMFVWYSYLKFWLDF